MPPSQSLEISSALPLLSPRFIHAAPGRTAPIAQQWSGFAVVGGHIKSRVPPEGVLSPPTLPSRLCVVGLAQSVRLGIHVDVVRSLSRAPWHRGCCPKPEINMQTQAQI
jgi:hypothetical protein